MTVMAVCVFVRKDVKRDNRKSFRATKNSVVVGSCVLVVLVLDSASLRERMGSVLDANEDDCRIGNLKARLYTILLIRFVEDALSFWP